VLGLGASGQAAARLLAHEGARVTLLDSGESESLRATAAAMQAEIEGGTVCLGEAALATLETGRFAMGILSPGIDPATPLVRKYLKHNAPETLIGELELSWRLCECPVVAITGTNGKTTTTQLVDRMFNACGVRSAAVGNIGPAFASKVAESAAFDIMTVEVSSFQLERIERFRPVVSVWLNFQPDHLDRYPSLEAYAEAKLRIFENQTPEDFAIIKYGEPLPPPEALKARVITFSAYKRGGDLDLRDGVIHFHGTPVLRMAETHLRGLHNAENLMAALAVGAARGLAFQPMVEALASYKPLPHRCESVRTLRGVDYVNDSKATNLDALEKALLSETRPVVLLAGGKDKGFPFDSLSELVAAKARCVVLIGEMAERIAASWGVHLPCHRAGTLAEAVEIASRQAREGDVVLLSPGTSSFDMFKSYADRGDQFRACVNALK